MLLQRALNKFCWHVCLWCCGNNNVRYIFTLLHYNLIKFPFIKDELKLQYQWPGLQIVRCNWTEYVWTFTLSYMTHNKWHLVPGCPSFTPGPVNWHCLPSLFFCGITCEDPLIGANLKSVSENIFHCCLCYFSLHHFCLAQHTQEDQQFIADGAFKEILIVIS